ncbi:hypothetical protein LARV_00729 [Longilinea arvoryzae]|uniref:Uncharacterized protein n=1 Tax=Longilinea arvoryzae TaxID=360412 RepID=A0A0S7B6V4_9CHLR|nr:hypothetical protein LARV_00729 [Longilinea arvoryzae]
MSLLPAFSMPLLPSLKKLPGDAKCDARRLQPFPHPHVY